LRKKGALLGQTSVLKQGLRKPEYGDRSDQIKGRQRHTMAVALHPLPLFPVCGRNFAGCGRLSIEKGAGYREETMHGLIYLVGLIVVILAILSFFGLR
jgi:hypothetical protein